MGNLIVFSNNCKEEQLEEVRVALAACCLLLACKVVGDAFVAILQNS
jgi:hypothetical protein